MTYSIKYRDYQRNIRNSQIERAQKLINSNPKKIGKPRQNDFKRFIEKTNCTKDGEITDKEIYSIDAKIIAKEEIFDGFYGVCTNLEDDASEIIKVNKNRWKIEAHFTTCFISLIIYL